MISTHIPSVSEIQLVYKTTVKSSDRPSIGRSEDAYQILKTCYDENSIELREEFIILLLNRANRVLGKVQISTGCTTGTMVDIKFILAAACKSNAVSVIISHNHPSGNLQASKIDHQITKKIQEALRLVDITVLDHLIMTREGYMSFSDEGYL